MKLRVEETRVPLLGLDEVCLRGLRSGKVSIVRSLVREVFLEDHESSTWCWTSKAPVRIVSSL